MSRHGKDQRARAAVAVGGVDSKRSLEGKTGRRGD